MGKLLIEILNFSEVWALLFPAGVLLYKRNQPRELKPVILYVWIALVINIAIDVIMVINISGRRFELSNNPLYNAHSLIRFLCFSVFFILLPQNSFVRMKKILAASAMVLFILNFILLENFFSFDAFSGNLLTTEAYLLLIFCLLYYLSELKDDSKILFNSPEFWVVTGLAIYVVVNFFVFLFYLPMIYVDLTLAINIWNVHNIAFIIFCLFLTRAFYGNFRYQLAG